MTLNTDTSQTSTAIALKHQPPKLPNELWDKVFQNLPSADIKAVRLTWKVWKDLGARYLVQPFVFRRDRDDFARFERVMSDPALSAGVTRLIFETGTMNVIHILCELSRSYMIKYNHSLQPGFKPSELIPGREKLGEEHEAAITEYAEWNNRCWASGQSYQSLKNLLSTLQKPQVLERIDVTRQSISFESKTLFAAWI
jgi:hypothetical protein